MLLRDRRTIFALPSQERHLRFGREGKPLPLNSAAYDKIRDLPKPLAVQIFLQPLARADHSIRSVFFAMGIAFFGTLGIASDLGEG